MESDTTRKRKTSKRRGNGEGSIYQRGDGRWCATVNVGYDGQGKRVRRTEYGDTKRQVQEKLTRLQTTKLDGTLSKASRLTVGDYLDRWLQDGARPTIRATTYQGYESTIRIHIKPRLGGIVLSKLGPVQVQGLYADMERTGASAYTRLLAHAVLHRALKQACKWGMAPRNACDAVDPPRIPRFEAQPLTASQVKTLLAAASGDRLEAIYSLAIGSGLRLGELFGLQWADIDLDGGAVTVRHTLQELRGKLELAEPKTAKSRRRVQLPAATIAALWAHKARMLAEGFAASPWVFCNASGGALRRGHFHRRMYKPLLKRAGLPPIRFHDLRHTAASLLLSAGVQAKVVQERLGHSHIGITMDIYSHVMPGMQQEAADKMDRFVSAAVG